MLGLRGSPSSKNSLVQMPIPASDGHNNGHNNGHHNGNQLHDSTSTIETNDTVRHNGSRTISRKTSSSSHTHNFSSTQKVTVLRQTVTITRSKLIDFLTHVDEHYIDSMTVESFLEYVETERLTYMPRQGSRWDKVLKWAEFFALQISGYEKRVESFVPDSKSAAKLILAACRVLIELGETNSHALEATFAEFYKIGLTLSFFRQHHELLSLNSHIRGEVGNAFNDLLILVRDVSLYYRSRVGNLSSEVVLDFNGVFGGKIEAFYRRKDHIVESMWECRLGDESVNIAVIRKWLGVKDKVVRTVLGNRKSANSRRDEYTCEWFQRPLLDFSRSSDHVLNITGPSGSGKSVLSGWIVERLQRPLGKKTHETLYLTIAPEIPGQCTAHAIAKQLALQLLDIEIGDIDFYEALEKAHAFTLGSNDDATLTRALWDALDIALEKIEAENLMIVIDGLDERAGSDTAATISNHVSALASKHRDVKAIFLSRNPLVFTKTKAKVFPITPDHTHNDIRHITDHALHGYEHFEKHTDHEQEAIVDKLADAAHGNFLWVQLLAKKLKLETSHEAFHKAVNAAKESEKSVDELIHALVSTATSNFSKPESLLLLSWLLVAQRPLTLVELKGLLQVDLQKKTLVERKGDVSDEINSSYGTLLRIENGIVRFRHGAFREYLVKMQNKGDKLQHIPIAQADFTKRLLAYCKLRLKNPHSVSLEHPETSDIDNLFLHNALLEYATRNWIWHFQASSLYKPTGPFGFSEEFKGIFPNSVQFALTEWSSWGSLYSYYDQVRIHGLALRIREEIFTANDESVLQNIIICGQLYKKLSNITEASSYFYRASRIGQVILKAHSTVTISCATTFLEITETVTSTTRTELITHKEELLQYVITASKHKYGKTSDMVIRYTRNLAELYVSIHEEHKAEKIWRELREIMIVRYGKGSAEETSISETINITLKPGEKQDDIVEYERNIFDTTTEMEIWDVRRIKITLKLAAAYEARGELLRAEELFVMLWGHLVDHCHQLHIHNVDIDVHISMIDVALEYVRFLRRLHRDEEAGGILICIWTEYEEYDFESEIIFLRLKVIGELMRSISLLSIAVSIFKKCWSWFKSHGKIEHVSECQILISETVQEIVTTTQTTTVSTTTTSTTTTETIIKEVFESTISKSTVTVETISICKSLVSFYMKTEQWSEAIKTSKRSLELIWRMVISTGGTIALPREFGSEAIEIAIQLAICHHKSHHFHEAESIYLRIYRACFNSCHIQDDRVTKAYTTLVKFYQEHEHWHQVIEIYQEILVAYRKHLGPAHASTIKILYTLGSLCHEHGHGHAREYYEEIIAVVNKGSKVCHHDAIIATKFICRYYYEAGHWQQLKHVCELLWETFVHHHHEHKIDVEFFELLYTWYVYVLEHHSHAGYEVIRTITIQYRDTCVTVFGASIAITIKALIELAQISMRSEKYVHEAISYYEEVIKIVKTTTTTTTTTTVVSTTTITKVKEQLTKAYIHVCSSGSASTTIIERAILILTERFEHLKITFGYSHTETLTVLRELVIIYWKQKTKESHAIMVKLLLESTIAIISTEKHSRTLYEAAKTVGGIYLRCGLVEEGRKLLRDLHSQIISKSYTSAQGFKIDRSIGKQSYVFLVTFEEVIQGSLTISYSKTMTTLLTETILYESYTACINTEKNIDIILSTSAKLYVFLKTSHRKEQMSVIRDEVYKIFIKKWGASLKTRNEITFIFFQALLLELGSHTKQIQIGNAACIASTVEVKGLLENGQVKEAYEVALCAFQFIEQQRAYHSLHNVGYGFKLSGYMANRGLEKPVEKIEPELRKQMLDLSKRIISDVLKACKESEINFVRLKLGELNGLVGLLGEQGNYADLEWLLTILWSSREVQKSWSPTTIISLGRRLVEVRFLSSHQKSAISLAETIVYNLRRVWGALDPKTLEMEDLLSEAYTAAGHHREAMRVHEEILKLVVEGDDGDDRTLDTMEAPVAAHHVLALKQTHLRLKGWDKHASVYAELISSLLAMPQYAKHPAFASIQPIEKWSLNEKVEKREFQTPKDWEFVDRKSLDEEGHMLKDAKKDVRPGWFRRVTSNWGIGENYYGKILGRHEDEHEHGHGNGRVLGNGFENGGHGKGLPIGAVI